MQRVQVHRQKYKILHRAALSFGHFTVVVLKRASRGSRLCVSVRSLISDRKLTGNSDCKTLPILGQSSRDFE